MTGKRLETLLGWGRYKLWRLKTILLAPFKEQVDALYDEKFFSTSYLRFEERRHTAPKLFADVLVKHLDPHSVVDIGCGIGTYLHCFQERGREILGVDGSRAAVKLALIPPEKMIEHDLRKPLELGKKFDLAICSEVAEHIPNRATRTLLETVTRSSDTVVFSSPYGGPKSYFYHCNEKPGTECIRLFKENRFQLY